MTGFKNVIRTLFVTAALSLSAMTVSAATIDIDISGAESWDGFGSPNNLTRMIDLGMGSAVTIEALGWDLSIETIGASWLSEAVISFSDTADTNGIDVTAGVNDGFAGTGSYSSDGLLVLNDFDLPNIELADGILVLTFFESFDDVEGEIDAIYQGFVSVMIADNNVVPQVSAPSIIALLGMGVFGLLLARRR